MRLFVYILLQIACAAKADVLIQTRNKNIRANEMSVCRLGTLDSNNKVSTLCSGILIAPNTVATASHCVDERFLRNHGIIFTKLSVECGQIKPGVFLESHIATKWNAMPYDQAYPENDFAFVLLDHDSSIHPIKVALYEKSAPEKRYIDSVLSSKTSAECRIAGYGDSYKHNYVERSLLTASINLNKLKRKNDILISKRSAVYADYGDSGGPIYCKIADQDWTLVGIASKKYDDATVEIIGINFFYSASNRWASTESEIFSELLATSSR